MHQSKTYPSEQKDQMSAHNNTIHNPFLYSLSISFKSEFRVNAEAHTMHRAHKPHPVVCLKHTIKMESKQPCKLTLPHKYIELST